ncbi:hypothetical protein [Streptomyces sp. NRRL S-455]|uniref:hypothetical protein n=1 Tax=Streptomyces sp. NRRL S-455 TaxID=1463908 RepID=UPI001F1717ED|nr:hypothetical protein [Streptomyces sp. NRRL S-455]
MRSKIRILAAATVVAVVGMSTSAHANSGEDETTPADGGGIVLNDGRVIGFGDEVTFTFEEEPEKASDGRSASACPEVNDKPKYTVKGSPYFIASKPPKSTWLLPGQSVSWALTDSYEFTWDIGASAEAEAGVILARAKTSVDTKISNKWTWSGTQTVTDKNTTTKGYRAVLGQQGWKLTATKTWIAPPCNVKKKTIVIKAPRKGDISIGRKNS